MSVTSQGPDWRLAPDGKWHPPPPAVQTAPPPPEILAARRSARTWGCFVPMGIAGIIVVVIIVVVIIGVVNISNSNILGGLNFGRTVGCTSNSPTYPDKQSTDCVATDTNPNPIGIGGAFVTATWTRSTDSSGTATICAAVNIVSLSSLTISYNEHYWSLQTPAGSVANANLAATEGLGSGELVQGGSASGNVCFDDPGQTGTYVGIYKNPLNPTRGIWLVPFT
jgi:hypothetical protein